MNKQTLLAVGEWAEQRVSSGEEPPWTYFKLKQLAELTSELAAGFDAVTNFQPSLYEEAFVEIRPEKETTDSNVVDINNFRDTNAEDSLPLPT